MAQLIVQRSHIEACRVDIRPNRSQSIAHPNDIAHGINFASAKGLRLLCLAGALAASLFGAAPVHGATITSLAALSANDSAKWSQLGNPGDNITTPFAANSTGGIKVVGAFAGAGGTVDQVCPTSSCNYGPASPGFNTGDFLILTEDANGNPTGPLTFSFLTPVRGAGLYLQLDAPGTFTATLTVTGGTSGSESITSDGAGDPVFLGALDATSDITKITVGISSCTAASQGVCSTSDFAVDTLFLNQPGATVTPEPADFLLVASGLAFLGGPIRLLRRKMRRPALPLLGLACAAGLIFATPAAKAQDTAVPPGGAPRGDGSMELRDQAFNRFGAQASVTSNLTTNSATTLPIWNYQVTSPVDGNTYTGYMVGTSPFNRGARTTTVPVVLIPVTLAFHNTTSGFTTTFDPTSTPDAGCTAGQTAMSLAEGSPVFQNLPWTMNGVNVGTTQYVDAFRRADFWQYVKNTGNAYHTLLTYTVGAPLTLAINYASASADHQVFTVGAGTCTNPSGSGVTNAGGYTGGVNINTIDAALQTYISGHGITANQFPLFIMYNVVMSLPGSPGFYDAGYHASQMPYPGALTSPGQTYGIADIQTNQFFSNAGLNTGTSILSHEVSEWMNDPGVYNATPKWGHIGQVSGCQNNLETGDALTGTNLPPINVGGYNYHLQELVFYSWFFRIPSTAAGGLFSDNGTFGIDAGAVCH